ncbi:MAG: hypothetical protein CBB99_00385 [Bacteroidetes bacterium TMED39]|nr:MAG: hypothetical protein CBB99_00385 [Bacteroidetes bacterium TMED39]
MGAKLIKITNFISHRTALSLLIFTIFCRLPFFFRDIYDWDESTFLLVGQSLLDGHLPFTKLWDLKPALLGYIYGFIIFFFREINFSHPIIWVSICLWNINGRLFFGQNNCK